MNTLTLKLPAALDEALAEASRRAQISKSELVRRAVASWLVQQQNAAAAATPSALDLAGDLVGCFTGGPADLASNPAHMDGFGRV